MLSEELLRKVKQIEITTRKVVDDVMTGQYRSHFKGQGVQFSEHRLYLPGDDIRHINWSASARSKEPLLKIFEEERELTVFLVVDCSASGHFGSNEKLKSEIAAEVGGMLAYAASHTGDRVGILLFAGDVEHIVPPKKGRAHIQRVIRDLLSYEAKTKGTDLKKALDSTGRIMKHSGVVFVLSDFIATGYEASLRRLAKKHDVVTLHFVDERETLVPDVGQILLEDPETEQEHWIDTGSYAFREWFKTFTSEKEATLQAAFKGNRIESIRIFTHENYGDAVVKFFRARSRRR